MFVDASVLVAILAMEADAAELVTIIGNSERRLTSALAKWETCIATSRVHGVPVAESELEFDGLMRHLAVDFVPVTAETARLALAAHDRFGKGRHPAKLNFGDCFAYASAREHRVPLLFKGTDFALTNIESAMALTARPHKP